MILLWGNFFDIFRLAIAIKALFSASRQCSSNGNTTSTGIAVATTAHSSTTGSYTAVCSCLCYGTEWTSNACHCEFLVLRFWNLYVVLEVSNKWGQKGIWKNDTIFLFYFSAQNGPITSWPSQRQVLVPSWQQLPNVTSQRPVQQPMVATDSLTTQGMPDSWRRSLMVDNFDQGSSIIPMVTKPKFLFSHGEILFSSFLFPRIQHPTVLADVNNTALEYRFSATGHACNKARQPPTFLITRK